MSMRMNRVLASVASLMLVLSPISVYAEDTVYASDESGNNYTSIDSAWNAAMSGTVIHMTSNWDLTSYLEVSEGVTATIMMDGYQIRRSDLSADMHQDSYLKGQVIYMDDSSNLTLDGSGAPKTSFTFSVSDKISNENQTVKSGGLITGGRSSADGCGINMSQSSTLTLKNVAIAGNISESTVGGSDGGAGINMNEDNVTVNLVNSIVAYNYSPGHGGGILIKGDNAKLSLDNSSISNNVSNSGAGVYSDNEGTVIELKNKSHIDSNTANSIGGGVYIEDTNFKITSTDDTVNTISNNTCSSYGGGIYVEAEYVGSNSGEISNLTFEGNTADDSLYSTVYDGNGGAINIDQENIKVSNCIIKSNYASDHGGGIYNSNDNNTIENCTIQNNKAGTAGGGVYQYQKEDITLSGKVIITDNKRTDETNDDLMLEKTWAYTAYVKGEVTEGSKVGIRTGDDEETQIGKDITSDCTNYLFLNDSGSYHISYEDGKVYKREGLTGSVFGNGNTIIAGCVMVGIVVIGVVVLVVNKKKTAK